MIINNTGAKIANVVHILFKKGASKVGDIDNNKKSVRNRHVL